MVYLCRASLVAVGRVELRVTRHNACVSGTALSGYALRANPTYGEGTEAQAKIAGFLSPLCVSQNIQLPARAAPIRIAGNHA
uniref:Uncharacterized protein n=1 Tax=Candidatus Kentrum sp. LPFa TaxID=2126335 RepID=A0A450XYU8_9GAMM|nr:MAG: hypothetical protein BECKLPF1236A_GA0070988_102711 [Candidatus Kentron sp. LPFa]VFK34471.1 MAG: hypothetical protein BECKLPF1236C_GA0070990_102736 [Candidatus Kentron sp. LPFa]